jgi:hypothetical protein
VLQANPHDRLALDLRCLREQEHGGEEERAHDRIVPRHLDAIDRRLITDLYGSTSEARILCSDAMKIRDRYEFRVAWRRRTVFNTERSL